MDDFKVFVEYKNLRAEFNPVSAAAHLTRFNRHVTESELLMRADRVWVDGVLVKNRYKDPEVLHRAEWSSEHKKLVAVLT